MANHQPRPYRCIMPDNAMQPAISKGDKLDVDPRLPIIPGKEYVFTQTGKEERPFVAELVSATDDAWIVRQFNPSNAPRRPGELITPGKSIRLSRYEWPAAHRVFRIMYADD